MNKKGSYYIYALIFIVFFMTINNYIVPKIALEYSSSSSSFSANENLIQSEQSGFFSSFFDKIFTGLDKVPIIGTLVKLLIWNWDIPTYLNLLLMTPLRIIGYVMIYMMIRGI
jgi:hypothetical protein